MDNSLAVISLGGSLMVPDAIDAAFLKKFRALILRHIKQGRRFIIICGGGKTARRYQDAAKQVTRLTPEDLDWLGIHSTRLNAHLLRTLFRQHAHPQLVKNPTAKVRFSEQILIAAGWKPGFSTDYDAVLLARRFGVKTVINLSNIPYVYDKDPNTHRDARPLSRVSWKAFRKMAGDRWDPGLNVPFDPVASREAEKLGLRVVIMDGRRLDHLDSFLKGDTFRGTVIS